MITLRRLRQSPQALFYFVCLVALVLPNIALALHSNLSLVGRVLNLILPLGIWATLLAWGRKPGKTLLIALPWALLFNCVQLVLLIVFGWSVISVDLLLSLFSASGDEAGELLGGLILPVLIVLIVHIAIGILAYQSLKNTRTLDNRFRAKAACSGLGLILLSIPLALWAQRVNPSHTIRGEVYPLNTFYNIYVAGKKLSELAHIDQSSATHSYKATSEHTPEEREVYIFVLGETSRAYSYQLYGYPRETNPKLSRRDTASMVIYRDLLTQSNTTSKSAPILLSPADAEHQQRLSQVKGIMTAMREAGFYTVFISNQPANRSFLDHFAFEANEHIRIKERIQAQRSMMDMLKPIYDADMLPFLDNVLKAKHLKLFVIMHCYGAHWSYADRYPKDFSHFRSDRALGASPREREPLTNAYDNAIRYTDYLLDEIITRLERDNTASTALYYTADHGEDVFDDARQRILHSSPTLSYYQLHVPGILWLSHRYRELHPTKTAAAKGNQSKAATSRSNLHTLLELAGIKSYERQDTLSLMSPHYREGVRSYLNDRYECVPLAEMVRDPLDQAMWQKMGLKQLTLPTEP